ncbi:MAG: FAD-binding oxidoreductase [Microbacterium sp.]|nr:FAD-binding oxidoreductase [Microbacterium sp.]
MTHDIPSELDRLRTTLRGTLLTAADPGWDAARAPWNLSVDQHPRAIVTPLDVEDVRAVLTTARTTGLAVTVQPHGHGAADALDDVILVRPTRFDELSIDVGARMARVGAGVDWGRVLAALDGTGLVALAGSNPEVSVVGYSLAGGHSGFSRAFGLASNAVQAIELVTADGTLTRVDAVSDPDLFWALRGGGGLFGIVTAMEFRLFPLPSTEGLLYGGKLTFPGAAARAVLAAMSEVVPHLPDEVSVAGGMVHLPDAAFVPEPLRGTTLASVDVISLLDRDTTEGLIEPVRTAGDAIAATIGSFPVGRLPEVAAEPVAPVAAIDHGLLLRTIQPAAIDALVDGFDRGIPLGLSLLQIRPLGGAIARGSSSDGVAGRVGGAALVGVSVVGAGPGMDRDRAAQAIDAVLEPVRDFEGRGIVATFLSAGDDLGRAYDTAAIARLRTVKDRVDTDGMMRSNRMLPREGEPADDGEG